MNRRSVCEPVALHPARTRAPRQKEKLKAVYELVRGGCPWCGLLSWGSSSKPSVRVPAQNIGVSCTSNPVNRSSILVSPRLFWIWPKSSQEVARGTTPKHHGTRAATWTKSRFKNSHQLHSPPCLWHASSAGNVTSTRRVCRNQGRADRTNLRTGFTVTGTHGSRPPYSG